MALYMIQGTYTAEAWAALAKNPQDRRIPIREVAQKQGAVVPSSLLLYSSNNQEM